MRISVYIGKRELQTDARFVSLMDELRAGGCDLHVLGPYEVPSEDAEMLLCVGGDGTFLSSAALAAERELPVMGVNLGRLGFRSENRPEDVAKAILAKDYAIESRTMLRADIVTGDKAID
jgi:NAD+ kinase